MLCWILTFFDFDAVHFSKKKDSVEYSGMLIQNLHECST